MIFDAEFVRRKPGETFHPDCMTLTVKHGGGSVMDTRPPPESSTLELFEADTPHHLFQQNYAPCKKSHDVNAGLVQTALKGWNGTAGPITYRAFVVHIQVMNCKL